MFGKLRKLLNPVSEESGKEGATDEAIVSATFESINSPMSLNICSENREVKSTDPAISKELSRQTNTACAMSYTWSEPRNTASNIRLPPISQFGILDLRKPHNDDIRLGSHLHNHQSNFAHFPNLLNRPTTIPIPHTFPAPPHPGYIMPVYSQPAVESRHIVQTSAHSYPINDNPYSPQYTPINDGRLNALVNMAVGGIDESTGYSGSNSSQSQMYHCSHPGCNKSFPSRSRLTRHEVVHLGQKNWQCIYPGCSKKFSRKDNMLQHYRNHLTADKLNKKINPGTRNRMD